MAIPQSCFDPSLVTSLTYLLRDIIYTAVLLYFASRISAIDGSMTRILAWLGYGFFQGCVWTGLWILGHECGHGAFSKSTKVNDIVGWVVHSFLLVPYYSWKITHARHHRYHGHIEKDVVYVPLVEAEAKTRYRTEWLKMLPLVEETPIATALQLIGRQLIGWQLYLCFNITAGKKSAPIRSEGHILPTSSHFDPYSALFTSSQRPLVIYSNIGLCITISGLCLFGVYSGWATVALVYLMPYIWVHHWLGTYTLPRFCIMLLTLLNCT
jgi:tryptophan-rich sensory protein